MPEGFCPGQRSQVDIPTKTGTPIKASCICVGAVRSPLLLRSDEQPPEGVSLTIGSGPGAMRRHGLTLPMSCLT
jgi:hypothetical protein